MKNFSTQKDRVLQFIDYKGISKNKFYIETGISNGILDKKSGLSMDTIEKFYSTYPEINPEWLLTGEGSMLKEPTPEEMNLKPMADALPLVMPTAIGGYGNSAFNFTDRDVKEYYVIPKFKHKQVDFMIEVEGSSMYPKYNSGDVVACRIIKDSKFIQWNKAHVVATHEQGIIIKRIKPSDNKDTLLMVSDNQSYDPFEIPKEEIEGLAIVVGVVRLE